MAPTYNTTALNALRWLPGSNLASDIDAGFQSLAEDVDARLGARVYAEVLTSQTTSSGAVGDLATVGPSVTISVPANALIAVFAQVTLSAAASGIAEVHLAEDGTDLGTILSNNSATPTAFYTLPQVSSSTGTPGRANSGWLTFPATTGSHTYKLRYASPGLTTATFVSRRLWVRTVPA